MNPVFIIGRFPPPLDGQALATARLGALLNDVFDVRRIDTEQSVRVRNHSSFSLSRIGHFLRLRRRLRDEVAQASPSVVLWPAVSPTLVGHVRDRLVVTPSFQPSTPVVAIVHRGNFHELFQHPIAGPSARQMVDGIARFVFLSETLAQRCDRWIPPQKRTVIPNTIDNDLLFSDEELTGTARSDGILRLLFVANMIPSKGYMDVLRAVDAVTRSGLSVHATFAGQWMSEKDRTAFEMEAERRAIGRCVSHLGAVSDRQQIRQLYKDADVYVLPSYYENEAQPLTIIEALNAGLPVITTRHAGIPDMVTDGREAFMVPPRDPSALASIMQHLANPTLREQMSAQARRRFIDCFSPERVRLQWIDLMNRLA